MIEPVETERELYDGRIIENRPDVLDVARKLNELIAAYNQHTHEVIDRITHDSFRSFESEPPLDRPKP